jgi:DHA1 family multidrug resistance protein-like MFS transporter
MTAYTLFQLGQVFAQNIETLLVTRFFSGFFAVAPPTNFGGKFFFDFANRFLD